MEQDRRYGRCPRCGDALDLEPPESEQCPRCGGLVEATASAPPFPPDAHGVPVARFAPTSSGAPVAPEPYASAEPPEGEAPSPAQPPARPPSPSGRLRFVLPQSSPRRAWRLPLGLTILLATLVFSGLVAGLIARDDGLTLRLGPPPAGHAQPTAPPPTATPACSTAPIDPTAAAALTQATLTTGLRNPSTQDFRPVDSVTTFSAGQRAYLTFQITTAQAGTAGVTFCTPTGQIPGALEIPARSNGHYAQFSLPLDDLATGPAVVTLTWNGAVAASLPFTIVP